MRRTSPRKMGHSFCPGDAPLPRLTPLVQHNPGKTEVPAAAATTQALSSHPPKRRVRSSGFAHRGAKLDIYEYAASREQTALRDFLRGEAPTVSNDGVLERKDSKRVKKALLGGLFHKGKNAGLNEVAVRRKTSDGKKYFQIVVDEVEMERERREREQGGGQQKKSGERETRTGKEDDRKGEGRPVKTTVEQVCNVDAHHSEVVADQTGLSGGMHPPKQDPEGKTGAKAKTKGKSKTKPNINPGETGSPVRTFRLLPKPDLGSTGRDLASEGSGILARFGVAADTKNEGGTGAPDTKDSTHDETQDRHFPMAIRDQRDKSTHQVAMAQKHVSGSVPMVNNLWPNPDFSKASERSAPPHPPEAWSDAAISTLLQDPTQESIPHPSTKLDMQRSPRCSESSPTLPWPKNTIPITPQHSAHNSITQAWHTDAVPITPQHSAQNSIETKKSPSSTLKHSRGPSGLSAHGSIVDDGQSDVGSIEIMNAQSAEIVRVPGVAGLYARGAAKLPKPGPAPTRALPSLPEGHDGPGGVLGRVNGGSQSRMGTESALERSPVKLPPSSPNGKYRYSPCKSPAPKPLAMPVEPVGAPDNRQNASDLSTAVPSSTSAIQGRRNCSLVGEMNAAMLEQTHIQRVRSTNQLKGRDLQRLYSDQASMDVLQPRVCHDEREGKTKEVSFLPSASYTPSIAHQPITKEVVNPNRKEIGTSSRVRSSNQGTACTISPIIVVSEQAPMSTHASLARNNRDTRNAPGKPEEVGILRAAQEVATNSPRLPPGSEDKDGSHQRNLDTSPEFGARRSAKSRGSNDTTNHLPASDQLSFTDNRDLESKFEARLSALEKKNTMLLRVIMTLLDESGTLSAPSGGDRSSGLSSTSSLYGSRESRLEAMFDAVLSFLQENKRLSGEQ